MAEPDGGGLHDVAGRRGRQRLGQGVGCVELDEPVARGTDEAALDRTEGPVEGGVDRLGVVPVCRVGGRARVVRDRDGMARRRVDQRRIRTAVAAVAAAVAVHGGVEPEVHLERAGGERREHGPHDDRVAGRVGEVVRLEAVLPAPGRAGHAAGHPGPVESRDRIGHVAGLEVGEGGAVGDDVLQGLDVRVVDRRVGHVREDAVGDREPDLGGPVPRRAEAILAGKVEVGQGARAVGGGASRESGPGQASNRCRREDQSADRDEDEGPSGSTRGGERANHRVPPLQDEMVSRGSRPSISNPGRRGPPGDGHPRPPPRAWAVGQSAAPCGWLGGGGANTAAGSPATSSATPAPGRADPRPVACSCSSVASTFSAKWQATA